MPLRYIRSTYAVLEWQCCTNGLAHISRVKPALEWTRRRHPGKALILPRNVSMADELYRSLERLRIANDITSMLAAQLAELRKLREAVQRAEAAMVPASSSQRYDEVPFRPATGKRQKENRALPGRLFMQSQWR